MCESCHNDLAEFTLYEVNQVTFPSGVAITFGEGEESNLCLHCHQGRESTDSVNRAIGQLQPNEINERLTFRNIHYFAAGATLFGGEARGGYQYAGQEYVGRFMHVQGFQTCNECHDAHALDVAAQSCLGCHAGADNLLGIRSPGDTTDYDGDGDTEEGVYGEIATMKEALYDAFRAYAADTLGQPIVYYSGQHPYFFNDLDGDGEPGEDEISAQNRYASWSPRLLRAAYNYQYASKDTGGYSHNAKYIMQLLYDSIQDVGGSVQGMTRPTGQ
jgi:hypothetical protein